ncbi:MAG: xanthine dehydrogenase family protein subunit M [Planctomycetota bacterium]|nr:xanthine dehydrogenase family protein subunit M [Planctomycetota bacterium]
MKIITPTAIEELLTARAANPDAALLAGGTDLLAGWHSGGRRPEHLILLGGVRELDFISVRGNRTIEIGATATHSRIASNSIIRRFLPALAEAALSVGSPAVRNMGTIGGNIVNASPAADLVPPLIVYNALVRLVSFGAMPTSPAKPVSTSPSSIPMESVLARSARKSRGKVRGDAQRIFAGRDVPIDRFYTGYKTTDLRKDEVLFSVVIPVPSRSSFARYYKLGTRKAQSIAKVSLAGRIEIVDEVISVAGLAAGSVAPIPLRLRAVEDFLRGKRVTESLVDCAAEELRLSIAPIDDVRSTSAYRRFVTGSLLRRFLADACVAGDAPARAVRGSR